MNLRLIRSKNIYIKLFCLIIMFLFLTNCSKNNSNMFPKLAEISITENKAATETDVLLLVNKENKIPDGYTPNLTTKGAKFDKIMLNDFEEMLEAARCKGVYLYIREAYRSSEEQEEIYNNYVSDYIKKGYSKEDAIEKANQIAALPGHSEHETGLAIDFSFAGNIKESTKTWEWLNENAYLYGFILRYPEGKEAVTGYDYEPWHYRYVGKQHAREIYQQGLVLEEYLFLVGD